MNLFNLPGRGFFSVNFHHKQDLLQQCMAVISIDLGHLVVSLHFTVSGIPHRLILVRTNHE